MALQFVLGSSGSGKTEYIYERLVRQAGEHPKKNYLVIVPEQFTMQTQQKLVELAPNHAIMNIDVLSFKRLAYRVFDDMGMQDIQVLEETYLITLSRSSYGQLLQESSEWFKFGKYISDSLLIKKCRRETSFLMDNAFERYKLLLKTYPQVEQHLSQYYIAAYLGIKPESLSRLKSLNIGQ